MTRNEIISNLFTGKNFQDCLNKMEPDHLREDLRQEVILIICELSAEKIHQLYNDKALEFYTVRVILNQIKSKSSPFYKKYRQILLQHTEQPFEVNRNGNKYSKGFKKYTQITPGSTIENTTIEMEERELREMIEDLAVEEVDKLYWYNKGLIELYIRHGNFRAIEAQTGIPFGSCYKTIKKSFNQIKQKVK